MKENGACKICGGEAEVVVPCPECADKVNPPIVATSNVPTGMVMVDREDLESLIKHCGRPLLHESMREKYFPMPFDVEKKIRFRTGDTYPLDLD